MYTFMDLYAIIAAEGFDIEVMPLLQVQLADNKTEYELIFVDDAISGTTTVNGHRAINMDKFIEEDADTKYANIAIANQEIRKKISDTFESNAINPIDIKAHSSICMDEVEIGPGSILCHQTILTSNIKVGKYFHANIFSYVGHDCVIGDYVTFGPNVHCNGNIKIKDNAYIGTGAIIKNGTPDNPIIIGERAIVGMGAVVNRSVPDHTVVVGNPARKLKTH